MAISHIQPCLLLLLASLFFLPALVRSAEFKNCLDGPNNIVHVNSLEISPDSYDSSDPRTGTFTLTADSTQHIDHEDVTVYLDRVADYVTYFKEYSLCNVTACRVDPGPLTLMLTDVFSAGPETKPIINEEFVIQFRENKLFSKAIMCIHFRLQLEESLNSFSA